MEIIDRDELRRKIQNESDMLIGCRNRMCVTDDENELAQLYISLNLYAANLYRMNLKRLHNEQNTD